MLSIAGKALLVTCRCFHLGILCCTWMRCDFPCCKLTANIVIGQILCNLYWCVSLVAKPCHIQLCTWMYLDTLPIGDVILDTRKITLHTNVLVRGFFNLLESHMTTGEIGLERCSHLYECPWLYMCCHL